MEVAAAAQRACGRFYFSKWATFAAAAVLMLSAGLPYSFSIYGEALGSKLGYSLTELAGVGTAGNIGGYLALVAGLFYDAVSWRKRTGPKLTVLVGCCLYAVGFLGLWGAANHRFDAPYWLVCVLAVVANNGGCWLEAAALTTAVRNFETERGVVVGILKAFLGLSASTYTTIYMGFIAPRTLDFLLLLGTFPVALSLAAVVFVNYVPFVQSERHLKSHAFHMAFVTVLSLAMFQMVASTALAHQAEHHQDFYEGIVLNTAMITLLIPILSLPFIFGGIQAKPLARIPGLPRLPQQSHSSATPPPGGTNSSGTPSYTNLSKDGSRGHLSATPHRGRSGANEPLLLPLVDPSTSGSDPLVVNRRHTIDIHGGRDSTLNVMVNTATKAAANAYAHLRAMSGIPQGTSHGSGPPSHMENLVTDEENMSPLQTLCTPDFWLLAVTAGISSGAGLILSNNLGALVASLGGAPSFKNSLVSTYSVANCLGRLFAGFVPERAFRRKGIPRTAPLACVAMLTAVAAAGNAFASLSMLPHACFVTGLAFGAVQGIVPAVTSELFGLHNFASNYGFVQLSLALGSYGMATLLAGEMYQRGAAHRHAPVPGNDLDGPLGALHRQECFGAGCFRWTFLIAAALCVLASGAAWALTLRSKQLYARLHDKTEAERHRRGKKGEVAATLGTITHFEELNAELQDDLRLGKAIADELRGYVVAHSSVGTHGGHTQPRGEMSSALSQAQLADRAVRLGNILATAMHNLQRRAGVSNQLRNFDFVRQSMDVTGGRVDYVRDNGTSSRS